VIFSSNYIQQWYRRRQRQAEPGSCEAVEVKHASWWTGFILIVTSSYTTCTTHSFAVLFVTINQDLFISNAMSAGYPIYPSHLPKTSLAKLNKQATHDFAFFCVASYFLFKLRRVLSATRWNYRVHIPWTHVPHFQPIQTRIVNFLLPNSRVITSSIRLSSTVDSLCMSMLKQISMHIDETVVCFFH